MIHTWILKGLSFHWLFFPLEMPEEESQTLNKRKKTIIATTIDIQWNKDQTIATIS